MTDKTKITAALAKSELDKLRKNWFWNLYHQQLDERFVRLEAEVLNNPQMPTDELRTKVGTLSGIRTALTLPITLIGTLEDQEDMEKQNVDE